MAAREKPLTALIVGAGAGGIALSARLAKAGFQVTVVEKNDFLGGRCSLIHRDGHRFDQGPSLLLLPELFREQFYDLDTSLEAEGVKLLKCDPNYNIWFGDGKSFELSSDLTRMKTEIEKWEGKDGFERYLGFLQESHRHYEISVIHVLHKNFGSFFNLLRPSFLPYLLELHPFVSIYSRASKYFYTDRLRRVFTFGSMYMGMSPYDAPGTYSLLQYTELAEGIWYPEGGFNKVLQALVKVSERFGVKYRYSSPVASINLAPNSKRATGITLESGETLTADVVISNADLVYAYNNLLPHSSYANSLSKREASCSSISFYWAMDTVIPQLEAHNIFLADAYKDSFDSIFKAHGLPEQPSFYVNVPSRVDPSAAPEGKDTIVVLCPCGHLTTGKTPAEWEALVNRARAAVIATVESRTGASIAANISSESINTPLSWKDTFNLDKGAILGLSHSFFNVLAFRPGTKHRSIKNLYFVGASTHPGTGVPIVLAGSKITGEQILKDYGMTVPWGEGSSLTRQRSKQHVKGDKSDLDVMDPPRSWTTITIMTLALFLLVLGFLGLGEVWQHLSYLLEQSVRSR